MTRILKLGTLLFWYFLSPVVSLAQQNYIEYHQAIIRAEEAIFVDENTVDGFATIDSVFSEYDFAFIDDCLEFFQLALYYDDEIRAYNYIQKAIENGFRIEHVSKLNCGCPHNYYKERNSPVTLVKEFINRHADKLNLFEQEFANKYLKQLDSNLIRAIIPRHVNEQLYKNFQPSLGISKEESTKKYLAISHSNLNFIIALFRQGNFIGERNMGLLDTEQYGKIGIDYESLTSIIDERIATVRTEDYFHMNILFTILFHNGESYSRLVPYAQNAIRAGYLHPREYAFLLRSSDDISNRILFRQMHLDDFFEPIEDVEEVNKLRAERLLPTYEVDFIKHQLSHIACLKLNFGFFNASK